MTRPLCRLSVTLLALAGFAGCSPRVALAKMFADAIASGGVSGGVYASDDDPELVRQAVPSGLKTMEGLLEEQPRHTGLLTALASGFTQYAYAFVQADAESAELEGHSAEARALRDRARGLFLRGRDYGLRGLEVRREGLEKSLREMKDVRGALARAQKEDVPLLYWSGAAWALAISNGKGHMELVAELPVPEALMARALELDEPWEEGAIHDFYVAFEGSRERAEQARAHLARSQALSKGKRLGPLVSYAESVSVHAQDRGEFRRLLEQVLAANAAEAPRYRLANVLAQRRARDLLAHADDLFL